MGSGLILLVIVGAWLAVLVPMALRSYDASATTVTLDRLNDAARRASHQVRRVSDGVRTRRLAGTGRLRPPVGPTGTTGLYEPADADDTAAPGEPLEPLLHRFRDAQPRPPLTLVARRRRVLLSLLGVGLLCLLGALVSLWLLVPAVLLLAAAAAYVVHLRRLAVHKAERSLRAAGRAPVWPVPVTPLVDTEVYRPAPLWTTSGSEDVRSAAASGEWSPVPVPPPVYLGKPIAPPRASRALDLGAGDHRSAGEVDDELDDILEGRRAVGGW